MRAVADAPIGSIATLSLLRQGRQTELKVPIAGRNQGAR